jgi:hypothetical protein
MSAAGAMIDASGAYYEALSAKAGLKLQADQEQLSAEMSFVNARMAEGEAFAARSAGRRDLGRLMLRAGAAASARTVSVAAGGVSASSASAAEVRASERLMVEIDQLEARQTATRAAAQATFAAVEHRNRASASMASARNARRSAHTIRPWLSATTSLLGSAASIGAEWFAPRR